MLLYLHPMLQLLALVVAWPRIATLHLGSKRIFRRARHVFLGELCLGGVILGAAGGAIVARMSRGTWLASGAHAWGGLALAALALARPRPRKLLPLAHGLNNLASIGPGALAGADRPLGHGIL